MIEFDVPDADIVACFRCKCPIGPNGILRLELVQRRETINDGWYGHFRVSSAVCQDCDEDAMALRGPVNDGFPPWIKDEDVRYKKGLWGGRPPGRK